MAVRSEKSSSKSALLPNTLCSNDYIYVASSIRSVHFPSVIHPMVQSMGDGANFAVLATTFDTLVAVLVKIGEVKLLVGSRDNVPVLNRCKLGS
jgi:hypothetical protein